MYKLPQLAPGLVMQSVYKSISLTTSIIGAIAISIITENSAMPPLTLVKSTHLQTVYQIQVTLIKPLTEPFFQVYPTEGNQHIINYYG